jgi:hypothetical protein
MFETYHLFVNCIVARCQVPRHPRRVIMGVRTVVSRETVLRI